MNYFDNPAMSQSKLKDLKKSPKHFWAKHLDPKRDPEIETEAMIFGTAAHMCLFEHQKFIDSYISSPAIDRRTKEGKAFYADFIAKSGGKIIINPEEMIAVKRMRDSVLNKKTSRIILNGGTPEEEFYWTDSATGLKCKMKPDYNFKPGESELFPDGLIIDYKTTTNANPDEFAKTIYNFGYHNQAAFYQEGFLNIFGVRPPFILLPIEKNPPYECGFFMADEMMIKIGSDENRKLLDLYNDCYNNNRWPGYEDKLQTISLPAWIINKYNFEENVA